ncbi:hypothetical protein H6P81_017187 [Aristolochia fimbriata]|uniref:Uncharacterized protein n=1 Tax=Aristolochia fimbriata TaxID=158543 RepID=A0AAV7E1Q9_ARIFI|nr:hypothetical protein H6P81_017187 [Aristolochia fimbriata]
MDSAKVLGKDAWLKSLREKYESVSEKELKWTQPATIHRVPHIIRRGNESAYEPEIVAIGPYHRRNVRLWAMEKRKWQYLHSFCTRCGHTWEEVLLKVHEMVGRAQRCYSSNIDPIEEEDEFVEMMMLDACFILELFFKSEERMEGRKDTGMSTDPVFGHCSKWVVRCVARDLLLAENQLPFFVLQKIFDSFARPSNTIFALVDLAMGFFKALYHAINYQKKQFLEEEANQPLHLLHLVHAHFVPQASAGSSKKSFFSSKSLLPSFKRQNPPEEAHYFQPHKPLPTVPRAQRLQDSGIRFKKGEGKNFLDIKFENGVMEIPHFIVDHYTNTFLRNLIAFEQSYPPSGKRFTMYAAFMDFVVNTDKDVEILHQHGILDHGLGSEQDIALLFNEICKGLIVEPEENDKYLLLVSQVIQYSNIPWNMWRAKLNRDYFGNPWTIVSVIAGIVALFLTFTNTFFNIYSLNSRHAHINTVLPGSQVSLSSYDVSPQ